MIGGYWLFIKKDNPSTPIVQTPQIPKDISPGKNAAVLTLANGKKFVLDTISGKISDDDKIINSSGTLTYKQNNGTGIQYHVLTTGRGNQYKLILPDGSKVFLNSATSLRFPSSFTGNKREVGLDYGEAYFEISQDKSVPFMVNFSGKKIEVLGTSFNINNYSEEDSSYATLITGSVKVSNNSTQSKILQLWSAGCDFK